MSDATPYRAADHTTTEDVYGRFEDRAEAVDVGLRKRAESDGYWYWVQDD